MQTQHYFMRMLRTISSMFPLKDTTTPALQLNVLGLHVSKGCPTILRGITQTLMTPLMTTLPESV